MTPLRAGSPGAAQTRRRRPAAVVAACAAVLLLPPAATGQTLAPIETTPTLPSTPAAEWTGGAASPGSGTDRAGVFLGALPSQGLAAFELARTPGSETPQMLAAWQRGGTTPLSPLTGAPVFTEANAFLASSSSYGTLIAHQFGRHNAAFTKASILRPDGTWEEIPKLGNSAYDYSRAGSLLRQATLTENGTAFFTEALTSSASYRIVEVGAASREAFAATAFIPTRVAAAPVLTAVTAGGDSLAIYAGADDTKLVAHSHGAGAVAWGSAQLPLLGSAFSLPSFSGFADAFTLAAGPDGWAYLTSVQMRNTQQSITPHLALTRRTPQGAWETPIDLGPLSTQGVFGAKARVLPGRGGAATVMLGVGADFNDPGYSLTAIDIDAAGSAMPERLMSGPFGEFDVLTAPDGTQSLLWERMESQLLLGAGRWANPAPQPDSVAFQSRAGVGAAWTAPQLLSANGRLSNLDAGDRLAPRLQRSGTALYAAWYENRNAGTTAGLTTAVTGYVAPTPTPTPTPSATPMPTPAPKAAPAPTPGATPVASRPIAQSAPGSRTLNLDLVLRYAGQQRPCPRTVSVRVRKLRANGTLSSRRLAIARRQLTVAAVPGGCRVTGIVELGAATPRSITVGVTIGSAGFRLRAQRIALR